MQKPAVTVMVKAARLAGNVLLRGINKLDALNVVQKGRMDYASEVDADAEKVIIKELKRGYPEYAVFGEEGGVQGGKSGRYTWVIDPLDGTSNYLRGFPHYCVSIALVENGEPIDAVIFDPLRNELFTASRGVGAVLNDRRIRIAERKDLEGAMVHTGFPPRERARASAQLKCVDALLVQAEDVRRTGSAALDLAYVPAGAPTPISKQASKLGHRCRRFAGARGRWPRLRLQGRHSAAHGQHGPADAADRGRQHQDQRRAAEGHRQYRLCARVRRHVLSAAPDGGMRDACRCSRTTQTKGRDQTRPFALHNAQERPSSSRAPSARPTRHIVRYRIAVKKIRSQQQRRPGSLPAFLRYRTDSELRRSQRGSGARLLPS